MGIELHLTFRALALRQSKDEVLTLETSVVILFPSVYQLNLPKSSMSQVLISPKAVLMQKDKNKEGISKDDDVNNSVFGVESHICLIS